MKGDAQPFETDDRPAASPHQAGEEPIAGYRLIEPLGQGGFGEVWKCTAPGGFHKAVKFVSGPSTSDEQGFLASQEHQAIELIKNIRHPFILTVERVEVLKGTLTIVMELADKNLADLLAERHKRGQTGIERGELLGYLAEAAEALDLMNFQHGLQHLDVKPQNLFLVSDHVKVADFGLVNRLPQKKPGQESSAGQGPRGITPRYVAPEILQHKISRRSDQYSLAIVYQELLTSEPPFKGRNARQLFVQHLQAQPDLSALPVHDRPIVARALAKDPEDRFASCADLVRALSRAGQPGYAAVTDPSLPEVPSDEKGRVSLVGYTYAKMMARTPLGEVWQVQAPTGERRYAYHLSGFAVDSPAEQAKALTYLQSFRNPALLRFKIGEISPHRIILVFDPWGPSLLERCRLAQLGEQELLQALAEVAHAVDELAGVSNLYHLALNPETMLQGLDGIQLRDFGLLALLWRSDQKPLDGLNPRYGAPELALGRPGPTSDQYSLAMSYFDLSMMRITGRDRPRSGSSKQRASGVDLTSIPAPERRVLFKALDNDPGKRFGSTVEMIETLAQAQGGQSTQTTTAVRSSFAATQESFLGSLLEWIDKHLAAQGAAAGEEVTVGQPVAPEPTSVDMLRQTCLVEVLPGTAKLRLGVFQQEWRALSTLARDNEFRFFVPCKQTFWQRLTGASVGVEARVLLEPLPAQSGRARATFTLQPINCGPELEKEVIENLAPAMMQTLRQSLNAQPERRAEPRLPLPTPVTVRYRPSGCPPSELQCDVLNVSRTGIGFIAKHPIDQGEIRIVMNLPQPGGPPQAIVVKAMVKRSRALPNNAFEIGAEFVRERKKKKDRGEPISD